MTSHIKVAYVILLSLLTASSVSLAQAQQRKSIAPPSYTPPPAPRQVYRPEPQMEQRRVEPETRKETAPRVAQPENRPYNTSQVESRPKPGSGNSNVTVVRPQIVTPGLRRAMTYNSRPNSAHIPLEYFASHFGPTHGFHFDGWGPGCPTCGFTQVNGEWYFNWNGGNFGMIGQTPASWALATDYLYVDIGDDGNYYLHDAQYPDVAVQLTFVQNLGDDQKGEEQDGSN